MENIGKYEIIKKCISTKARVSRLHLQHGSITLPIFMPVGTYGALKACRKPEEEIILGNTFHLRNLNKDLHEFSNSKSCLLTDSGGFQMITLDNEVSEEGVQFKDVFLTPERSIEIQNTLNSDIIMQLDDVVNPLSERVEDACHRSIRWLDRCLEAHKNKSQLLFPIVQGGISEELREYSLQEVNKRINKYKLKGVAIGGLSGGEDKVEYILTVYKTCSKLPSGIPHYVMGVGYPEDIILSIALGADMSDCVYPTRTARFGRMLSDKNYKCECAACLLPEGYLRALKGTTNHSIYMTTHNLLYMRKLTERIRDAIMEDRFKDFIIEYFTGKYEVLPEWVNTALKLLNITI